MARNTARLKMGYYPLPPSDALRLRSLLEFPEQSTAIDPCAGTGAALLSLTRDANVELHAVELDTGRAAAAAASGIRTVQGNIFDAYAKSEGLSLLYLNPPYDSEINLTGNRRLERLFLDHTLRWLVPHGVLVFVIPYEQVLDCLKLLSDHFTRLTVMRLSDEEAKRFRQVVVLGERVHVRSAQIEENRRQLRETVSHGGYEVLPSLSERASVVYRVPPFSGAEVIYRGLPYNEIEDLLPGSAAWKQVAPLLLRQDGNAVGRPITPLHGGHVGLLCTAGLLNGVFGEGEERHIAYWRSVKDVTEFTEMDGDTTVVRRREKWSNELRLIYTTGRTQTLTENPPAEEEPRMKDAHLRLGMLEYERNTEKISTRIRVRVSHYIGEGADAHLLSVFGNDSDVGAITAAVHDQNRFRLTFPDGQVQEISLGERATCYRGGVSIPGRKHGIRHMVTLSEEIRGLGSVNRTYSLSNSPDVVWSTIVQRLGVPAAPEWAERMMELFEEKKRITLPDCIGYRALLVTATGEEVLQWLEELIVQKNLRLPERNGPIVWPQISMQSVMRGQLVAG